MFLSLLPAGNDIKTVGLHEIDPTRKLVAESAKISDYSVINPFGEGATEMKAVEGRIGRVFLSGLDHDDPIPLLFIMPYLYETLSKTGFQAV